LRRSTDFANLIKNVFPSTVFILLIFATFNSFAEQENLERQQGLIYPVINANNKQHSISKNGLGGIFKMRLRRWNDGSSVIVFVLKDNNNIHKQFSKQILQVFPHQMRRIWNRAVFSGSGQAPISLTSIEEMISKIASTPGAIGYLESSQIPENIRILEIR
jgi:ABC-type phosphate transport system substrate-binding protein